jgi:hypothetical protein
VSDGTDDPATGPAGERSGRPGPPPVLRPGRSGAEGRPASRDGEQQTGVVPLPPPVPPDRRHRTERLRFPLPAHPPQPADQPAQAPQSAGSERHDPETGRLYLGGYPPRVPGARPRPDATPPEGADSGPGGAGDD